MKTFITFLAFGACISFANGKGIAIRKIQTEKPVPVLTSADVLITTYEQCQAVMLAAKEYQYNLICPKFPKASELAATNISSAAKIKTYEECQAAMLSAKVYQYNLICPQFPKSTNPGSDPVPNKPEPVLDSVSTYTECQLVMLSAKEYQYNLICPKFPKESPAEDDIRSTCQIGPVTSYEECQSVMRSAKEYLYNLMCPHFPKSL